MQLFLKIFIIQIGIETDLKYTRLKLKLRLDRDSSIRRNRNVHQHDFEKRFVYYTYISSAMIMYTTLSVIV